MIGTFTYCLRRLRFPASCECCGAAVGDGHTPHYFSAPRGQPARYRCYQCRHGQPGDAIGWPFRRSLLAARAWDGTGRRGRTDTGIAQRRIGPRPFRAPDPVETLPPAVGVGWSISRHRFSKREGTFRRWECLGTHADGTRVACAAISEFWNLDAALAGGSNRWQSSVVGALEFGIFGDPPA